MNALNLVLSTLLAILAGCSTLRTSLPQSNQPSPPQPPAAQNRMAQASSVVIPPNTNGVKTLPTIRLGFEAVQSPGYCVGISGCTNLQLNHWTLLEAVPALTNGTYVFTLSIPPWPMFFRAVATPMP